MEQPFFFGIRHLSPAGAFYLRRFLDEKRPRLVLVEGPCDVREQLVHLCSQETKPPVAVLAYTKEAPVRTILYPFAEYSPEYQAVLWCRENGAECRFMDLPADVFLALAAKKEEGGGPVPDEGSSGKGRVNGDGRGEEGGADKSTGRGGMPGGDGTDRQERQGEGEETRLTAYRALDERCGEDGHETFWERTLEQAGTAEGYQEGANLFGSSLRALTEGHDEDWAETSLREAWMRSRIREAVSEGRKPGEIVVVTGAYHVEGLKTWAEEPSEAEEALLKNLPRREANLTLMPYSYYRLSSRSGYGAGNKAPAYYGLLWDAMCAGRPMDYVYQYLARIAGYQRANGNPVSSAEVIEAVRLSVQLAGLRGGGMPALRDLRDAAVTCLGGGSLASISLAVADTEIGAAIGSLPEGASRTSVQEDFYRQLKELRLEKYRDLAAQDLALDLRENRRAVSEKSAFLDLHRSFFLHQLRVLGVSFAAHKAESQENATWAEHWVLRWTPEAEIELVESALKGDTIAQAASFQMKEQAEHSGNMSGIARVIEDAFLCGMAAAAGYATQVLAGRSVDAVSIEELAQTAERLSVVLRYGNIRQVDGKPLEPVLSRIFYRACLLFPAACVCDDAAAGNLILAADRLNTAANAHDFLDQEAWVHALSQVSERDDLNTRLSGFAAAILLERGLMDSERLGQEVGRRLSPGVPADLGAGWFEGLAMKNRYALIARLSLWESLDAYLDTLDEEEFKRALVFLRRAFADFAAREKDEIAENLGEIWELNTQQVSEAVNAPLLQEEAELVESLEGFDFDF